MINRPMTDPPVTNRNQFAAINEMPSTTGRPRRKTDDDPAIRTIDDQCVLSPRDDCICQVPAKMSERPISSPSAIAQIPTPVHRSPLGKGSDDQVIEAGLIR